MFSNLEAEMARKGMTRNELAKLMHISPTTLGNKLNEKVSISLPECLEIKRILGLTDIPIEVLFQSNFPNNFLEKKGDV